MRVDLLLISDTGNTAIFRGDFRQNVPSLAPICPRRSGQRTRFHAHHLGAGALAVYQLGQPDPAEAFSDVSVAFGIMNRIRGEERERRGFIMAGFVAVLLRERSSSIFRTA